MTKRERTKIYQESRDILDFQKKIMLAGINSFMASRGITQADISRKLGVGRSAVNNWIRHGKASVGMIFVIAHSIGLDPIMYCARTQWWYADNKRKKAP